MFFERGIQSSTRHRKLRYLMLFALRALLVVLLALVFANPFVRRSSASANDRLDAGYDRQFVQHARGDAVWPTRSERRWRCWRRGGRLSVRR